ncbi:hypothetical protein BST95_09680 [Halioglobus japonicus]|nr:hypothetical protein BST95_09680 [Halioglobus japonicus]
MTLSAQFVLLEQEALLHITGPDTLKFLQGQTTCDAAAVTAAQAVVGAYCTPKGRMVCDFLLGQLGEEHYALRLRRSVADVAASTFGKYIVFSKADIAPERSDWQVVGIWGESSAQALSELGIDVPGGRYQSTAGEGWLLVQLDDEGHYLEAWIDMQEHSAQYDRLRQALQAGDANAWNGAQIRAGIGRVEDTTSEMFLPQDLNYDVTSHVNFSKGCYTGQEIVARLHYRGKAKRRAYPTVAATTEQPAAGVALYAAGKSQSVGTVVNSGRDGDQVLCLVSATREGLEQGLRVGSEDGPLLEALPLPYALED